MTATVIGVGNEFRGDDGIGPAVIEALRGRKLTGVRLAVSDGEPGRLLDLWEGCRLAVIVDALRTDCPQPGRIHRVVLDAVGHSSGTSSHGLGLGEALRLGLVLERLPRRVVVLAVEGAGFDLSAELSPPLADVVGRVADPVCQELETTVRSGLSRSVRPRRSAWRRGDLRP